MDSKESLLQFQPFSSFVDVSFWHEFAKRKLNVYKLSEDPIPLRATYACGALSKKGVARPPRLYLSVDTLPVLREEDNIEDGGFPSSSSGSFNAPGLMYNTNTLEGFKKFDKKKYFDECATRLWDHIVSGEALRDPSLLSTFVLFTYADLKKYQYVYHFAFPALKVWGEENIRSSAASPISTVLKEKQIENLEAHLASRLGSDSTTCNFFLLHIADGGEVSTFPLTALEEWATLPSSHRFAVFADPSASTGHPGWPLRNFIALIHVQLAKSNVNVTSVQVLCLRSTPPNPSIKESIVLNIHLPSLVSTVASSETPAATGWEKNTKGKSGPRQISLGAAMDPVQLASTAVTLNLKLMRWRVMPGLDLETVANTKCLIIGSGTLGCNVSRCLMGWGVRHITFVDNGKVSLSNPARQSLFTFEQSKSEVPKAIAAAEELKRIFPSMVTEGHVLTIPMPGHAVMESEVERVRATVKKLEELYASHDAVFLLTDSRESRWLPTLLGVAFNKIVINAAMGFDTFMCMRHGHSTAHDVNTPSVSSGPSSSGERTAEAAEEEQQRRLGCYFCNDVVAPQDSLTDRTLDQQCTVTRPGLSFITSAMAAELLVSILQHPLREKAPADLSNDIHAPSSVVLGIVPHQIRGQLSHFNNMVVTGHAYDRCTGCSLRILKHYQDRGFEFLLDVFNRPEHLEEVTGLKELKEQQIDCDWDDAEFFSDDE